jgi:hypothetical protein
MAQRQSPADEEKIFLIDSITRRVREIYSAAPRSINQDNHLGIRRELDLFHPSQR